MADVVVMTVRESIAIIMCYINLRVNTGSMLT